MTSWEEFSVGLAHELMALPAGAMVLIAEIDGAGRYVQFVQSEDSLYAELIGDTFLAEDNRPTPEGRRLITDCGWQRPETSPEGGDNWWVELPWPVPSAIYRQLASMVVVGLRDALGMPSPTLMNYDAWNANDGNRPLEMPQLGLARKQE
ncbi:TY-Chap domain-containing protein [Nocardia africana]|uniref:TY-Chap N-terminal domain-containing protein n=1 Tax=Nocardia africana TaxID=134964 RepID=A0A378WTG2_9NOCA|nr:hypothetical protein [Nocardia africana]MCC3314126.1 hypothetical protein [Nocardia africana]SUA43623.1 Uncharacterised protein [Nocardia africana]